MQPRLCVRQVLEARNRVHVHLAALSLALLALAAPAHARTGVHPPVFCGLALTVNGFDYVRAAGAACPSALAITVRIERDDRGPWLCSRSVGGQVELRCTFGAEEIDLLERSPIPARERDGVVTLANWSFRLHRSTLQGRSKRLWRSFGRAPWCIPDLPREALLALRLKPVTPDGGCFAAR